jgi:DNA-binding MarR family transcriptional regulator
MTGIEVRNLRDDLSFGSRVEGFSLLTGSPSLLEGHEGTPFPRLIGELLRTNGRFRTVFASAEITDPLSTMEATVLASVVDAEFPLTVPQIGRLLGHARQVIQRAADSLIRVGLLKQEPNPHHKRASLVRATAEGISAKRTAEIRATEVSAQLVETFGAMRCRRLADELRDLRTALEACFRSGEAKR